MNSCARRTKEETPFQVGKSEFFRIVCLLVFIEKVVTANVKADPQKEVRRCYYMFGSYIQKVWDALPTMQVSAERTSKVLQDTYLFASRRDAVCVRTLLNTCLVLLNHLKDILPEKENLQNAEGAIFMLLGLYDPNVDHEESQRVGEEIATEILSYMESL